VHREQEPEPRERDEKDFWFESCSVGTSRESSQEGWGRWKKPGTDKGLTLARCSKTQLAERVKNR